LKSLVTVQNENSDPRFSLKAATVILIFLL